MITGKVQLKVDGVRVQSENDAELDPGGETYESKNVQGTTHRMSSEDTPAIVSFKLAMTENVDVTEVSRWKNKTLTFITDTGQRYLIRDAFVVGRVKQMRDSADVEMHGPPAEKG